MTTETRARDGLFALLSGELSDLVERLRGSTVVVRDGRRGAGSGIIWQRDGVIVTNAHVVQGSNPEVRLSDGRTFSATVRVSSTHNDLAVLDIAARDLPSAVIGDSDDLRVGELVFAVGNPLGLSGAVTTGIITARPLAKTSSGQRELVQADIILAPGNSGGLLATASGKVVGVNAMVRAPGLALAVPSNMVTALIARPTGESAYLGITIVQVALPDAWVTTQTGNAGFVVTAVATASPAAAAGLAVEDVIVGADGDADAAPEAFSAALANAAPGQALDLLVLRGGRPRSISVVAGQRLAKAA